MRWWWPRRRRDRDLEIPTWPGPPAPLPGGAARNGDAWSTTPLAQVLDEPTLLLPAHPGLLTRGQRWRGGGWREQPPPPDGGGRR